MQTVDKSDFHNGRSFSKESIFSSKFSLKFNILDTMGYLVITAVYLKFK